MLETLPGEIIGASSEAARLRRFVEMAAKTSDPVTILGEPGTGKQLAARLIHEGSSRSKGPFLMVDCSLFFERELKRELFGYVAASAREKARKGLLEFACRGTCYLSRIEELSPGIQANLLELVKTGRFARLGDGKSIASGVRLIVSSAKNLAGFVGAGLFDSNLYGEISKASIRLAPLRERKEDVPALVEQIASRQRAGGATRACLAFSSEALRALEAYAWPGNLEELEKEVLRLVDSSVSPIRPEHLAMEISSCWLGQRGDPEVRKVLEELDGHIREFRVLSRLDLSYGDLVRAAGGGDAVYGLTGAERDPMGEL